MIVTHTIVECWLCPMHRKSMDGMECGHPYFKDKVAWEYDNMIINQDNMREIPEKCPLRQESLMATYEVKL